MIDPLLPPLCTEGIRDLSKFRAFPNVLVTLGGWRLLGGRSAPVRNQLVVYPRKVCEGLEAASRSTTSGSETPLRLSQRENRVSLRGVGVPLW